MHEGGEPHPPHPPVGDPGGPLPLRGGRAAHARRPHRRGEARGLTGNAHAPPPLRKGAKATSLPDLNLLIVSDLHLSEGRDPSTGKFSEKEDFFFDEEFARFLAYHEDARRWPGARWHLVVNGDFLDLLQVTTVRDAPPDLNPPPGERGYGLACGERETVYKLARIAEGHRPFFEALAGFVAAGHVLTIIKGNHDVEFHYRGVRAAFVETLRAAFGRRLGRDPAWGANRSGDRIGDRTVLFSDWYYFEKGVLWVEHGSQYEGFNSFKYWLCPLLPAKPGRPAERNDEIDLPAGSLFVRYLFNRVETVEPFADNIKPAGKFASWLLRKHPVTAVRFAYGDGRHMLARIRRAWADVGAPAWKEREERHNERLRELGGQDDIEAALKTLDDAKAGGLLKNPGFRGRLLRAVLRPGLIRPAIVLSLIVLALTAFFAASQLLANMIPDVLWALFFDPVVECLRPAASWAVVAAAVAGTALCLRWALREEATRTPSFLKARAEAIAAPGLLDVRYVVMGHTHDAELYGIGWNGGREKEYFNTGTWTKVFSEEERLVRGEVEFVFALGLRTRDGLRMKLMAWDDGAGEPRLLKLLRDGKAG